MSLDTLIAYYTIFTLRRYSETIQIIRCEEIYRNTYHLDFRTLFYMTKQKHDVDCRI